MKQLSKVEVAGIRFELGLGCVLLMILSLSGCFLTYEGVESRRARFHAKNRKFEEALKHYDRIIKRSPRSRGSIQAAEKAASISFLEIKDFPRAIDYYRHLIVYSPKQEMRYRAQKQISEIYFEKLNDYANSILEYNKLLKLPQSIQENYENRLRIAKSHFQLNDFFQSEVEIKSLMNEFESDEDKYFELSLFKASIFLTTKKIDNAIDTYIDLLNKYSERAVKENVPISLAIAYEEKKEFGKAIRVLQDIEAEGQNVDFIQLKIKRLEDRARNQPGAAGLRR